MLDKIGNNANGFYINNNSAKDLRLTPYANYNNPFANSFDTYNQANPVNVFKKEQTFDKMPVDKRASRGEKVGMGILFVVGLAIGADYLFCKGKHSKSLLKRLKGETKQGENLVGNATGGNKKPIENIPDNATTTAIEPKERVINEAVAGENLPENIMEAKKPIVNNTSEGVVCNKSCNGKTHNISVKNGKNAALSSCYIDGFFDVYGHNPKGYVDKKGMISGLYLNDLNSSGGGMGTEAVKQVVLLSKELGQEGRVFLHASIINNVKGTPVPFYSKIGFKAMSGSVQEEIEKGMQSLAQKGIYTGPKDAMMYLPLENISTLLNL